MWLERQWYRKHLHPLLYVLTPLSLVFWLLTNLRRSLYRFGILKIYKAPVPVLVVGNISVGGTGKTPTVLALIEILKAEGYIPGVVSRGYGAKVQGSHTVRSDDNPETAGDEPLMLRQIAQVPVVINPNRAEAVQHLITEHPEVDFVISDDGMQHYALGRDIEVILVDAERGLGNGWLLPTGPLREGPWRLRGTRWVVSLYAQHPFAHYVGEVKAQGWRRVVDDEPCELPTHSDIHAIAGIGNPERFFTSLRQQHIKLESTQAFPDHYRFSDNDLQTYQNKTLLMTQKDAAKCRGIAASTWYYQPISAHFPEKFTADLLEAIRHIHK
ncbi:lipid-A-disaccharide kinase [Idiomarina fontislapidosi]|uniref:Tetraacyldisaccharide 4'-kinase n=1 Tax=Idiomarina fontislapidosi TaxID=263723 RepID=A0A432Y9E1_9GAMM|nr:tetraacyldisaccharide 4'-kinase [Idiomarina fontislapidosi]PYE34568.1 lipid-A-disaccharide kinase [Idiomarina fontislapidosi]RUO57476.1 tetraacyldisaccharide 4'-kinase [Idiomarina fontislapidosi]